MTTTVRIFDLPDFLQDYSNPLETPIKLDTFLNVLALENPTHPFCSWERGWGGGSMDSFGSAQCHLRLKKHSPRVLQYRRSGRVSAQIFKPI